MGSEKRSWRESRKNGSTWKQMHFLKRREWVDGEIEVVGKGSLPDKLYRYFLVEKEYGGDFISCKKICVQYIRIIMFDPLRSCMVGKKSVVNEVRLGLHKALQYGFKDKYKLDQIENDFWV
ncbi:hypothetical protein M9H77_25138 [Catharanthus roseus]|uniref:Uncharacterized protein n=1 Tax=Catharanthus roseus TaxID=4058 RepID=A0ACC0A7X0_CATRO|nr:hypothetical protein M9H77_25138 [Catharanthus roseus]